MAFIERSPDSAFESAQHASGPEVPSRAAVVGLVAALLSLHPLAGYLYLPTLPLLRQTFGATTEATQWTLSAFVTGFGVTQLAWGALADRFGRRPVLLLGLGAYLVAAIGCLIAADIWQIVGWRALQGAGVAAAGVCARAMLRDLYRPAEAVRMLSLGFSWLSVVAIAAPMCGAAIVAARGASGAFELLVLIGVVMLSGIAWAVPETVAAACTVRAPSAPCASIWRIACHPLFRAYTALTACTYAGHYLFLAGSSFLLIEHEGLSVFSYGLVLGSGSLVHLAGTFACRHRLRKHSVRATVAHAAALTLLGGVAMAALALVGGGGPWALILPQWLYLFAHAVHQSCGQAAVMAPFPQSAGTAAALSGTVLPLVAVAVASMLAGPLGQTPRALPLAMGVCAVLTTAVAWTLVQRHGVLEDE